MFPLSTENNFSISYASWIHSHNPLRKTETICSCKGILFGIKQGNILVLRSFLKMLPFVREGGGVKGGEGREGQYWSGG